MTTKIHFIGMRGEQYQIAVKVWGHPDFNHQWHDHRMYGDIDTISDILVHGRNSSPLHINKYSDQDHERN